MAMISKRNAPAVEDQPLRAEEDDDDQPDPKAALNAMFAKRSSPAESIETEQSKNVGGDDAKEEPEPDPRAALMAMISKRHAPAVEDQPSMEEKEDQPDPKAALNAMFAKRSAPAESNETEQYNNVGGDEVQQEPSNIEASRQIADQSQKSPHPRNALTAMLKKQKSEDVGEPLNGTTNQSTSPDNEVKSTAADKEPPLNKDPKYEKYFRMLKMVSIFLLMCLWSSDLFPQAHL
jgi:hypothetical protein